MRHLLLLSGLLWGCSSKDSVSVDSGSNTDTQPEDTQEDTDTDTDTARDTAPPDAHSPHILSCDAYCEWHDIGDTYWKWTLACNVTDPEGLENIWNGKTTVGRGGQQITEYLVACNTGGLCTTGFREETDGILCSQATQYNFAVTVNDWDGNTSKPYLVTGRQK